MTLKQVFKLFPKDTVVKIFQTDLERYIGMGTIQDFRLIPNLDRKEVTQIIPAPDWESRDKKVIVYFYVRKLEWHRTNLAE